MTQFKPMSFEEGINVTVTSTSGFIYAATSIEIQEPGVMLDFLDNTTPKRVLVPWSRIASVSQIVQE
jgi:hypothetical protein